MGLFKKTKTLIMALVVLNLVGGGAYWLISKEVKKNNEVISGLARELNVQISKEQQLQSFKKILGETELDRQKMNSFFVPKEDVVSFIQEIENLANIAGVSVEIGSVEVSPFVEGESKNEFIEVLNIDLNMLGGWGDNLYFLKLVESLPYRVLVSRFTLTADRDVDGRTIVWEGVLGLEVLKIK